MITRHLAVTSISHTHHGMMVRCRPRHARGVPRHTHTEHRERLEISIRRVCRRGNVCACRACVKHVVSTCTLSCAREGGGNGSVLYRTLSPLSFSLCAPAGEDIVRVCLTARTHHVSNTTNTHLRPSPNERTCMGWHERHASLRWGSRGIYVPRR
jgi:hypothetical protein